MNKDMTAVTLFYMMTEQKKCFQLWVGHKLLFVADNRNTWHRLNDSMISKHRLLKWKVYFTGLYHTGNIDYYNAFSHRTRDPVTKCKGKAGNWPWHYPVTRGFFLHKNMIRNLNNVSDTSKISKCIFVKNIFCWFYQKTVKVWEKQITLIVQMRPKIPPKSPCC